MFTMKLSSLGDYNFTTFQFLNFIYLKILINIFLKFEINGRVHNYM